MKILFFTTAILLSLSAYSQNSSFIGKWTGSFYEQLIFTQTNLESEFPTPSGLSIITIHDYKIEGDHFFLTTTDIKLRPIADEVTEELNKEATCGISNWKTNQAMSVGNCMDDEDDDDDDDDSRLRIGVKNEVIIHYTENSLTMQYICEDCSSTDQSEFERVIE